MGLTLEAPDRVLPFEPWHLKVICPQAAQKANIDFAIEQVGDSVIPNCYTLMGGNPDSPFCCGGINNLEGGRGFCWVVIAEGLERSRFLRCYRLFDSMIGLDTQFRRLECTVVDGFKQGHRMARLLGFQREGLMRSYGPDGKDHHLYSLVKGGA